MPHRSMLRRNPAELDEPRRQWPLFAGLVALAIGSALALYRDRADALEPVARIPTQFVGYYLAREDGAPHRLVVGAGGILLGEERLIAATQILATAAGDQVLLETHRGTFYRLDRADDGAVTVSLVLGDRPAAPIGSFSRLNSARN